MALAGQSAVEDPPHSIPATMMAAVYRGINDVRMETVPVPKIGPGEMLVRVHSHCLVGDVFGTTLCECNAVLNGSMKMIAESGRGAIIYLHQTARGFNVTDLAGASALSFEHERRDSSSPEHQRRTQRQIGLGAQILSDLNLRRIRLLTNHPRRIVALEGFGIEILDQVPVPLEPR